MNYKLFLDLDDTLADFTSTARIALGTDDFDSLPIKEFWKRIIEYGDFFNKLDWLPDGKDLWKFAKQFNPTILSGIPLGDWASKQKLTWCKRELGYVPVELCFVKDKWKRAEESIQQGRIPILVDDRLATKESWERAGGVFIHHVSASNSIKHLKSLLM